MLWKSICATTAVGAFFFQKAYGTPLVRDGVNSIYDPAHTVNGTTAEIADSSSRQRASEDDFSWLDCKEFIDHLGTITKHAGTKHVRKVPGYSKKVCHLVLEHYKKHRPEQIDPIVNLSHHIRRGRKLTADTQVENVAGHLRRHRQRRHLLSDPDGCDGPGGAEYEMGKPGPGAATLGHSIGTCPDPSCPTLGVPSKQPGTCIPDSTNTFFNAVNLQPNYADTAFDEFEEFTPGYGGDFGYRLYVLSLDDSTLSPEASSEPPFNSQLWTGCDQDRAGDYDGLARLLEVFLIEKGVNLGVEIVCEFLPDGFNIPIIAVRVPNGFKIACAATLTVLRLATLGLETIIDQVDFQNGLVDGAEIQAAYFHTTNLLDKQCSAFYEAVCRCSAASKDIEGAYGTGCDGLDSNCDGDPDDCGEDLTPPEIDLNNAIVACSSGRWFETATDALDCVRSTVEASDDCNGVKPLNVAREIGPGQTCADSSIQITAEDGCTRTTTVSLPVQIDDELPPTVSCSVGQPLQTQLVLTETGPGLLRDIDFQFEASDGTDTDSCGIASVHVDVFANEIEDFNAQAMAQFFELDGQAGKLYMAAAICSTDSNGQCIKDPVVPDARLYTVQVTATDLAGRSNTAVCTVQVVPTNGKNIDTSSSSQRFLLTSFQA